MIPGDIVREWESEPEKGAHQWRVQNECPGQQGGSSHGGPTGKPCEPAQSHATTGWQPGHLYMDSCPPPAKNCSSAATTTMAATQFTHVHGTSFRGTLRSSPIYRCVPNHSCGPAQQLQSTPGRSKSRSTRSLELRAVRDHVGAKNQERFWNNHRGLPKAAQEWSGGNVPWQGGSWARTRPPS